MRITDLINWRQLSKMLSGNETSIRKESCPKKYEKKVDELLTVIEDWRAGEEKEKTYSKEQIINHIDKI